jgi:hypothetical protein
MSLSDYIRGELEQTVKQLTMDEMREKLEALEPVEVTESSVEILRRQRGK